MRIQPKELHALIHSDQALFSSKQPLIFFIPKTKGVHTLKCTRIGGEPWRNRVATVGTAVLKRLYFREQSFAV